MDSLQCPSVRVEKRGRECISVVIITSFKLGMSSESDKHVASVYLMRGALYESAGNHWDTT
jgi:hypothetical protein